VKSPVLYGISPEWPGPSRPPVLPSHGSGRQLGTVKVDDQLPGVSGVVYRVFPQPVEQCLYGYLVWASSDDGFGGYCPFAQHA